MIKYCKLFCLLLLLSAVFSGPVRVSAEMVLDLEQAVSMGLEQNKGIQAVREALKGAEYGVKSARGAFGPKLSSSYSYARLDERPSMFDPRTSRRIRDSKNAWELNLNIEQPLFTGFRILSSYEKANLASEHARSRLMQAEQDLVLEIQQSFMDLLAAQESIRVAKDSLARLRSHLEVSRSFHEVGLAPKLEVLQAQVDVAQAEQDLITATNNVENLKAALEMLLNLPWGEQVKYQGELEYLPFNLDLDQCRDKALNNRPDVLMADKSVQMALKDEKIAASDFYPTIAARLDYYRRGDDPGVSGSTLQDREEWQAGLMMEMTLFEWGKNYYAHEQARQKTKQLMAEYADLLKRVAFEVKSDYLRVEESSKRIVVARQALAEARESYRMAEARYEAQVGTNTDVLDAQAKLSGAEANLIQARADYLKALASLYNSMGEKNISLASF